MIPAILDSSTENSSAKKRVLIVLLLLISCTVSIYLLWATEPQPVYKLTTVSQLDSLITASFREFNVPNSKVRTQDIRIDSIYTRKRYIVNVEPGFSKTSFHYNLHDLVWPYEAKTIGVVEFPDRDLHIHVAYNETIHRSVYLYSESRN